MITSRCRLLAALCLLLIPLTVASPASALTRDELRNTLAGYLAHSSLRGASLGCHVQTPEGQEIYSYYSRRALIPASNVKLVVSASAVELFGPQYVFGGQVWSETAPGPDGLLEGNLYLVGHANPDGTQSVIWPLARALQSKGLRQINGDVVGIGPVTAADHDHGLQSARRLAEALSQLGLQIRGQARDGFCPRAPVLLAESQGPSLSAYLKRTNKLSENRLAQRLFDSLLACYADPRQPDPGFLLRYWSLRGLDTSGLILVDGSGYSRENRLTAAFLTGVLVSTAQSPSAYTALSRSLPSAGVDGTLRGRMRATAAEGCVWAKTGTLLRVSCLSGYVERNGPPRLAFSLLMNGYSCTPGTVRRVQDQMAIAMAQYVKAQTAEE